MRPTPAPLSGPLLVEVGDVGRAVRAARQSGIDVSASLEGVGGPVAGQLRARRHRWTTPSWRAAPSPPRWRCRPGAAAVATADLVLDTDDRRGSAFELRAPGVHGRAAMRASPGRRGNWAARVIADADLDARLRPAVAARGRRRLHRHRDPVGDNRRHLRGARHPVADHLDADRPGRAADRHALRRRPAARHRGRRSIGCSVEQGPGTARGIGAVRLRVGRLHRRGARNRAAPGPAVRSRDAGHAGGGRAVRRQRHARRARAPASCASSRRAAASPIWSAPPRPGCSSRAGGSRPASSCRSCRRLSTPAWRRARLTTCAGPPSSTASTSSRWRWPAGAIEGTVSGTVTFSAAFEGQLSDTNSLSAFVNLQDVAMSAGGVPVRLNYPARIEARANDFSADDLSLQVGPGHAHRQGPVPRSRSGAAERRVHRPAGRPGRPGPGGRPGHGRQRVGEIIATWESRGGLDKATGTAKINNGQIIWGELPPIERLYTEAALRRHAARGRLPDGKLAGGRHRRLGAGAARPAGRPAPGARPSPPAASTSA